MQKRICLAWIDMDIYHPDRNIAKMKQIICDHREADLIVSPKLVVHGHIYSSAPRCEIPEMVAKTPLTPPFPVGITKSPQRICPPPAQRLPPLE